MKIKTRYLTVYEQGRDNPYILLKGKWLQKLGFNIHDQIQVISYKDKLVVKKVKEPKAI